ncbi:hypothetical protein KIJ04_03720 [Leuconostoc gelidum subsp. gelidum]|uniref:hypothetical protein n=1 Tax=Leuconostoc gelidum TaxID=1244 RepID=UPI001CC62002|nr:hypothetical protein [Leuconostoc gelidum]MBZ6013858.1 hypothetical protein [Leuconostoc gelidum subsp. gelidum]
MKQKFGKQQSVTDDLFSVIFNYSSPENEKEFQKNMHVGVTYSLDNTSEWTVDYKSHSDASAVFNLEFYITL